jgi:hypothetical protein
MSVPVGAFKILAISAPTPILTGGCRHCVAAGGKWMASTEAPPGVLSGEPAGAPMGRRRRGRIIGGAAVVVAVALAGGLWLHWMYSAHALNARTLTAATVSRPVGATFYSGPMVIPNGKPVTVDLRSVTPRITTNTADATVAVLSCRRNGSISVAGGADSLFFCAATRPFASGKLTIDGDTQGTISIILAVTTHRAGVVTIDGVKANYREGIRRGSQDTGNYLTIHATSR